MINIKSQKIFEEAIEYIPGGVNSPVRAFKSVGLSPIFIDHAHALTYCRLSETPEAAMLLFRYMRKVTDAPACKVQVFNANDSKRHRNVKMVLEILDI